MYISLRWLQIIPGLNQLSLSTLCERLHFGGFEIEEMVEREFSKELDYIFDLSLTANRSDLWNWNGLKKEVEVLTQVGKGQSMDSHKLLAYPTSTAGSLRLPTFFPFPSWERIMQEKVFQNSNSKPQSKIQYQGSIPFLAIETKNLPCLTSPPWLQKILQRFDIVPTNLLLDCLMFVTIETGYPFFALDWARLQEYVGTDRVDLNVAYESQQEGTNLGSEAKMNRVLVLKANCKLVATIGMSPLTELEVGETTTHALIYGGLFDPLQVRKSSQSFGSKTHLMTCLEKNLPLGGFEQAYIRLMSVLKTVGIEFVESEKPLFEWSPNCQTLDFLQQYPREIRFRPSQVRAILGSSPSISNEQIKSILTSLDFQIQEQTNQFWLIQVPSSRERDIEKEIDLVEEIGRIIGFQQVPALRPAKSRSGHRSKFFKLKQRVRDYFLGLGLDEICTYTLVSPQGQNCLELQNPLLIENSVFRSTLLPNIIQKAIYNKNQTNQSFQGFEIGRVFSLSKEKEVFERDLVSGIWLGNPPPLNWQHTIEPTTWFEAKGFVEGLFMELELSVGWEKPKVSRAEIFHPGRVAQLFLQNQSCGFFGQLHPTLVKLYHLPSTTYLFEICLETIQQLWKPTIFSHYHFYSKYPSTLVDLAYRVPNSISYQQVQQAIEDMGIASLETMILFDYYGGTSMGTEFHSLGLRLRFQNKDRTLTKTEVDQMVSPIDQLLAKLGIHRRS